ncbi:MAG: LysM peptidoglycan-binding domain-containing protein [Planctomycetota bacterium]|jgi:nucleoid-associated protein YgaU
MNRVQRTALLAFFLLLMMAAAGWWLGGKQAKPSDASPEAVLLDPGALETVRLLPPEQRRQYVDVDRFLAVPVKDPMSGAGGRRPGGEVASAELEDPKAGKGMPASASYRVVRVRQGETLSHIAQRELKSSGRWREILAWNGITDERSLVVGQPLRIYDERPVGSSPQLQSPVASGEGRIHTVRQGEILGRISQYYYDTTSEVDRILAANNLSDPSRIKPGQKLVIPPLD